MGWARLCLLGLLMSPSAVLAGAVPQEPAKPSGHIDLPPPPVEIPKAVREGPAFENAHPPLIPTTDPHGPIDTHPGADAPSREDMERMQPREEPIAD